MNLRARHASPLACPGPDQVEVAPAKPAVLRADENETATAGLGVAGKMVAEIVLGVLILYETITATTLGGIALVTRRQPKSVRESRSLGSDIGSDCVPDALIVVKRARPHRLA